MGRLLLISLCFVLASTASYAIGPKKAKKVPYSMEVEGIGDAVSGAIIRIDGKLIALRGLEDLNETWSACRSKRGDLVGLSKFAQDVPGKKTCNGGDVWKRDLRCVINLTASDQRDGLRKIIADKELRCEFPDESQMHPYWSQGSHITRGGARVYSGECYIDDKSVSMMMLSAGLTMFDSNNWLRIIDPTGGEKYATYMGYLSGESMPKGPVHLSTGCGRIQKHLRKEGWFFESPR